MTDRCIAVGIPVHNGEAYLADALGSVLAQDHDDLLVLISDNGSNDGTRDICLDFARRDPRVEYERSETNHGAAWNYNRVFARSEGRCMHFKWAAHDDVLAPTFVTRCLQVLEREPDAVLCYPRTQIIDAHGESMGLLEYGLDATSSDRIARISNFHRFFAQLRNFHCNPVFGLFRRDALARTRGIGGYWGSDTVLLGEVVLLGRCLETEDVVFDRREHAARSMRRNLSMRDIARWFDPTQPSGGRYPHWRCVHEHLAGIRRAGIGYGSQLRCMLHVLAHNNRRALLRELRRGRRNRQTHDATYPGEPPLANLRDHSRAS